MSEPKNTNPSLDLKNMDAAQLSSVLSEHQNSLIKLVLVVLTLFMGAAIFNTHSAREHSLQKKISEAQQKLEVIKTRESSLADLNGFKSTLPKRMNEFELVGAISKLAKAQGINVISISPAQSKDMGLYDVITINFNGESESFKGMLLFLRKVEKFSFPLRIDSWSGHEDDNKKINFILQINAVLIHT